MLRVYDPGSVQTGVVSGQDECTGRDIWLWWSPLQSAVEETL